MEARKILAVRNDRFGEFLLTIPAFCALKQKFPQASLTLVVDGYVEQLAKRIPTVDEVVAWNNRRHSLSEIAAFSRILKQQRYDLGVIFNPSKELNIISFLAGIPLRAGYNRKWGFLLNRKIEDKKSEGLKHEVAYNLDLLKPLGINPDSSNLQFPLEIKSEDISSTIRAEISAYHDDFIAVHPWASNKEKEWPLGKFESLVAALSQLTGSKIALIGGQDEVSKTAQFCYNKQVINLTGKTSLIELAALFKQCRLLVTNDSGPMHLAAGIGLPVVAIFRKGPPSVSAKRWGPAGGNHLVLENENIEAIQVDEVLDAIKKILAR